MRGGSNGCCPSASVGTSGTDVAHRAGDKFRATTMDCFVKKTNECEDGEDRILVEETNHNVRAFVLALLTRRRSPQLKLVILCRTLMLCLVNVILDDRRELIFHEADLFARKIFCVL